MKDTLIDLKTRRSCRKYKSEQIREEQLNAAHAVGVDSCYIYRAREVFESEEGKSLLEKWGIKGDYAGIGNVILGYGLPEGIREAAPRKENYIIRV